ncbi:MAG: hypothetical protein AAFP70_03295 [Calditrichota bacterium]
MRSGFSAALILIMALTLFVPVWAQNLTPTRVSPQATIMQRIGLTDITINYH